MLKGFLGNNGTREHGPSSQILAEEREALLKAMEKATEEGKPQEIEVDGKKFVVKDLRRAGREIEPV